MAAKTLKASLLVVAFLVLGCNSTSEPTKTFNLCVHVLGAPFVPGSTGDQCVVPQLMRAGTSRTVEIEADMLSGAARTGTIAIEFAPNGWTVSLGGMSIDVPGKQTLTMDVPSSAIPGDYQIAVRVTSEGEQAILTFTIGVSAPI